MRPMSETSETKENQVEMCAAPREIDRIKDRYPFCLVWTPIPILTWLFPIIGHLGIGLSNGVIRDFAGPFHVSEDNFSFGRPTKYWMLDPTKCHGGVTGWDMAVTEASEIYKGRMHNLFMDNCHSHVATALCIMQYGKSTRWNMVWLAVLMLVHSKYVNFCGLVKTWGPFLLLSSVILTIILAT